MSHAPSTSASPGQKARPLIYVVDDEAMIVTLIDAILQGQGYELKLFRDPELLLKSLVEANPKPAVLVTDFAMGDINGLELIEKCKKVHPPLKTILISGSIDENFARLNLIKPDKFMAKPFQSKALIETVRALVES